MSSLMLKHVAMHVARLRIEGRKHYNMQSLLILERAQVQSYERRDSDFFRLDQAAVRENIEDSAESTRKLAAQSSPGRVNMPVCCRYNASRQCKACSCDKSGTLCVDCLPSRNGHCSNLAVPSPNGTERPTLAPVYCLKRKLGQPP